MELPFRAVILALFLAWQFAAAGDNAGLMPLREKFHLYLLIGQSNMAGRGDLPSQPIPPNPRILALNQHNEWQVAAHPLHFDKPKAGVGLGLRFAEAMLAKDDTLTIGLIPCAFGGSPLARWVKDGDLYRQAVARARIAMQAGTLAGILWHQGENDSASESDAATYGARLAGMIGDLRAELGVGDVPFVVGKLCPAFEEHPTYPFAKRVNEALAALPPRISKTACVDAAGLGHRGDAIHFDTQALIELGQRYAVALQHL